MDGNVVQDGLLVVKRTVRLRQRVSLAESNAGAFRLRDGAGRSHERKSDDEHGRFGEHGCNVVLEWGCEELEGAEKSDRQRSLGNPT